MVFTRSPLSKHLCKSHVVHDTTTMAPIFERIRCVKLIFLDVVCSGVKLSTVFVYRNVPIVNPTARSRIVARITSTFVPRAGINSVVLS